MDHSDLSTVRADPPLSIRTVRGAAPHIGRIETFRGNSCSLSTAGGALPSRAAADVRAGPDCVQVHAGTVVQPSGGRDHPWRRHRRIPRRCRSAPLPSDAARIRMAHRPFPPRFPGRRRGPAAPRSGRGLPRRFRRCAPNRGTGRIPGAGGCGDRERAGARRSAAHYPRTRGSRPGPPPTARLNHHGPPRGAAGPFCR